MGTARVHERGVPIPLAALQTDHVLLHDQAAAIAGVPGEGEGGGFGLSSV